MNIKFLFFSISFSNNFYIYYISLLKNSNNYTSSYRKSYDTLFTVGEQQDLRIGCDFLVGFTFY